MYIETFLLVSRFLVPQFVYRPIKKTFVHARSTPQENEYWILNCLENSISKSRKNWKVILIFGMELEFDRIFLQIFSLIDFSNNEYPRVIWI